MTYIFTIHSSIGFPQTSENCKPFFGFGGILIGQIYSSISLANAPLFFGSAENFRSIKRQTNFFEIMKKLFQSEPKIQKRFKILAFHQLRQ